MKKWSKKSIPHVRDHPVAPRVGPARAQQHSTVLTLGYDRPVGSNVPFPTLDAMSREARERCYVKKRQALYIPPTTKSTVSF